MYVKTYFEAKREMTNYCDKGTCNMNNPNCPFSILNNGMYVNCVKLEQDYPESAQIIMKQYLDKKFPEGYRICIRTHKAESVYKCNKYDSCMECQKVDKELEMVVDLMDQAITLKEMHERI